MRPNPQEMQFAIYPTWLKSVRREIPATRDRVGCTFSAEAYMSATLVLVLVALWVTLLAWATTTLARDSRTRRARVGRRSTTVESAQRNAPESPRPNLLFWFLGALAVGAGLLVAISGMGQVAEAMDHPDPFGGKGAEAQADAASTFTWGVVILTIGATSGVARVAAVGEIALVGSLSSSVICCLGWQ
jgi:hypothetical protein